MKRYFGYIRVSTAKQGSHGVSLVEQKAAIERYAEKQQLTVSEWFEERETAAKRGRAVFNRMLSLLRQRKADGVMIHKIDRSARNLKDWADLGELIDAGVEVHFAADALDLNSRGGRLSADIQAVVASDYVRNLREETIKGFYGRLKQGLYPLGAPIGYRNNGGGKPKTPDPLTAPLVRQAFELYATGRYTLEALRDELERRGLRGVSGKPLRISSLSHLLNNPFFSGIIRLKKSGETFRGVHEPLVSMATFERVQDVLKGKLVPRKVHHEFRFRRLLTCGLCGRSLIGERQKGHVYYRCHARRCPTKGIREEQIEAQLCQLFRRVEFSVEEARQMRAFIDTESDRERERKEATEATLRLALASAKNRLDRLTDAFVDSLIEKPVFEERRASLLVEIAGKDENLANIEAQIAEKRLRLLRTLELLESLQTSYGLANDAEKREIIKSVTSNRTLSRKNLVLTLQTGFEVFENCASVQSGALRRNTTRTLARRKRSPSERSDVAKLKARCKPGGQQGDQEPVA